KYTFASPPITLALFDTKEALFNTAPFNPLLTPNMWSNNPVLIKILQEYFNKEWQEANEVN
ncbi:MAG: hypothetical protein NWF01_05755, partial [Candidatus Bathyarchaeota archaeon]|nr:hypothetical protein [Candidatus Bathyarchaeota archaeon]